MRSFEARRAAAPQRLRASSAPPPPPAPPRRHHPLPPRRRDVLLSLSLLSLAVGSAALSPPRAAAAPRPIAEAIRREEEEVSRDLLRREKELEAGIAKLLADREAAEKEAEAAPRGSGFCVRPFGVDVVGISQTVALVGALVGGIAARQRKIELEEVNEKLRAINISLRKQARAGVTYAPGLNYAPSAAGAAGAAGAAPAAGPEESEARGSLREGRAALKEGQPAKAMVHFRKALMLTRRSGERTLERRAVRGCAVAKRALGDRAGAIADLLSVLDISAEMREYTGDTDALGAIADLYTELGDLEKAGGFYDRYIAALKGENSK